MQINAFLAESTLAEMLSCNAGECLSWIIVLFNILTVFYLAFCAWYKITKSVKLFGWVWSSLNVCSTIAILFFHTCIFTILSAVFTGLITMATLSVVFNKHQTNELNESTENKLLGYYVIFTTTDKKYIFRIYDKTKKFYMTSINQYDTIEETKIEIENCRKSGVSAMIEDRTKNWIKAVNAPKFVMYATEKQLYIDYVITKETILLKSELYANIETCLKCANKFKSAILSEELYFSKEIIRHDTINAKMDNFTPKTTNIQINTNGNSMASQQTLQKNNIIVDTEELIADENGRVQASKINIPTNSQVVANENIKDETSFTNELETQNSAVEVERKTADIHNNVVVPKTEKVNDNPFTFVYKGNIKKDER